jgi:hypothetical protein
MTGIPPQLAAGVPEGNGKPATVGVAVCGSGVPVGFSVGVGVMVGSGVGVGVGELVAVGTGVSVGAGVGVKVGSAVAVGTGVSVGFAAKALQDTNAETRPARIIILLMAFMMSLLCEFSYKNYSLLEGKDRKAGVVG